jgi:tetratricopeptide (TPR) repeat protein
VKAPGSRLQASARALRRDPPEARSPKPEASRILHRLVSRSVAAALAVLLAAACGSNRQATTVDGPAAALPPVDRKTLRLVQLPDSSSIDPSVQKQLRDGHAALTAKIEDPAATDVDLGFAYGEMGKLLLAAEYRDAAEPSLLNAQALTPNEVRWPYYLGHLYKAKGDSSRASLWFKRALQLRPDDLATLVWLGSEYLDQGRVADAEPLFAKAFAIQPRSAAVLFGMGRIALAKQEYARAVEHLERVLALDPNAVVIHYPLAMAYRGMGDAQKAEAHLQARGPGELRPPDPLMREVETLLESAVAYEVRGADALDERQWDAAADYFRKGIALAPNEPSLRHKLGTALAMKGDGEGAVQQFEEITRRWPKFPKAHYSLGVIFAASGRLREALDHLSAAVHADPTYSEARLQLAEALRMSGRFGESLPQYEATIKLNPRLADARLGYGFALAALRRFDEARTQFSEGARIYPERHEFAEALARLPPVGSGR